MRFPTNGPVHVEITNWSPDKGVAVTSHEGDWVETSPSRWAAVAAGLRPPTLHHVTRGAAGNIVDVSEIFRVEVKPVPRPLPGDEPVQLSLPHGSTVSYSTEGGQLGIHTRRLRSVQREDRTPSELLAQAAEPAEPAERRAPTRPRTAEVAAPPAEPVDLSTAPLVTRALEASGPVFVLAWNRTPGGGITIATHPGRDILVTAPEGAAVSAVQDGLNVDYELPNYRVTASPSPGSDQAFDIRINLPRDSAFEASTTAGGSISYDTRYLRGWKLAAPRPEAARAAGTAWGRLPGPGGDAAATGGAEPGSDPGTGPTTRPRIGPGTDPTRSADRPGHGPEPPGRKL